jgi:glycerol-3-phosphate acyltransferase PlsY
MNSLPIDTLAAFLLGALLGAVICGLYFSRRHDRTLCDGEPGYTHRTAEHL